MNHLCCSFGPLSFSVLYRFASVCLFLIWLQWDKVSFERCCEVTLPPTCEDVFAGGLVRARYNVYAWNWNMTLMPHVASAQWQIFSSKALKGYVICWPPWYYNESSWSANVLISIHYRRADLKARTALVHAGTYWRSIKKQNHKIHKHHIVTHTILGLLLNLQSRIGCVPGAHNSCLFSFINIMPFDAIYSEWSFYNYLKFIILSCEIQSAKNLWYFKKYHN